MDLRKINKKKETALIHNNKKKEKTAISQRFNRTKSELISSLPKIKKTKKIKKITKFQIEQERPHCFLYRIRKINPEINLNYQLELYQKKQRYTNTKDEEMFNENKYGYKYFLRKKQYEDYVYQPSLSQRERKNNFYSQNKKSLSSGQFRSITSRMNDNNKNNINHIDFSGLFEDKDLLEDTLFLTKNKKIRNTKYSTKNNTLETSRLFSTNYSPGVNKRNISNKEKFMYFKLKGIELRNKIHDTFYKATNASLELNNDICNSKNYDKIFGLNKDENKFLKKNYKKINDDKDKFIKNLSKCVELKNNNDLPRFFQYLDKKGKKIFLQAREMDKYNQNFLNKNTNKKTFALNSKFYVNKLIGELNELGADILATKKKFKGEDAIEPKNEKQFFHGLIKENLLKNLSNDNYFEEIVLRKNVTESLDDKVQKRIFALKLKNRAIRHKLKTEDYFL